MAQTALGTPIQISTELFSFTAKAWGDPSGRRVLALHGWLDNCASFDHLAPLLEQTYFIALDCAGHGQSEHRAQYASYGIWTDVGDVFRIADALGWDQFHLLGHSRGSMIAFLAAGTIPERILSVCLLEGIFPYLTVAAEAPSRLRKSIEDLAAAATKPKRYYQNFDQAVRARAQGIFPIAEEDALALATHGVARDAQGFYWLYDPKLMAVSEVGFCPEQADAFASAITAPVAVFIAKEGLLHGDPKMQEWLGEHPHFCVHLLPGGHHFHMHAQADALAQLINSFFSSGVH